MAARTPPAQDRAADAPGSRYLTVTQLSERIRGTLEETLGTVWVVGEISNLHRAASGHIYFTLKDANAQMRCAMWKFAAKTLRFRPDNGLEVVCLGKVSYFEGRGEVQLIVQELQPKGVGALQLAFEQLKKKLTEEGLFDQDRKRPLPFLPRRVGIVTSDRGAAIADMVNILTRRYPNISILLYPCRVQGEDAPPEIVAGIRALNLRADVDVLIVGRGGGSIEDLWAFNDESVARAIAASRLPVVSAVGHETDFTIADFVADLRAPTPSAAAELVVPVKGELQFKLDRQRQSLSAALNRRLERLRREVSREAEHRLTLLAAERLSRAGQRLDLAETSLRQVLPRRVERHRQRLDLAGKGLAYQAPSVRVQRSMERYDQLLGRFQRLLQAGFGAQEERLRSLGRDLRAASPAPRLPLAEGRLLRLSEKLETAARAQLRSAAESLNLQGGVLRTLDPEAMLRRGYSIVTRVKNRRVVTDAHQLKMGDLLRIRLSKGTVMSTVSGLQDSLDLFAMDESSSLHGSEPAPANPQRED